MFELIAVKVLASVAGTLLARAVAGWAARRKAAHFGHMD